MSDNQQSSYRSIFKATSLFGGLQIYTILLAIIRTKVVAVLLGPTGVGIIGLYSSAISMIQGYTSLGLSTSAVRDVSEANSEGDFHKISNVVLALRRLVWGTGLMGCIAMIVFSPLLSLSAFGNKDYIIPFILLSIILLINQIVVGQRVVLQGMRRLKDLAKSTALGATAGLAVTIPLYYIMGIEGIVPTLIINAIITLFFSWYFSRRIKLERVNLNLKQTFQHGSVMLKMGIGMSLSSIFSYTCTYVFLGYLRDEGGEETVGFVNAGFTILTSYVGMIFAAISTDYYPRLAGVCKENVKMKDIMNQQGEIAVLIMAPILVVCLVFLPLVVKILYTDSFMPARAYVFWGVPGMIFKMGSWLLSYQIIAKGDMKKFVANEISSSLYFLVLSILGYKLCGMAGLGIAFSASYLLYYVQVYFVTKHFYNFDFSSSFFSVCLIEFLQITACMVLIGLIKNIYVSCVLGVILLTVVATYSFFQLDKRMGLLSYKKRSRNNEKIHNCNI